MAKKDAKRKKEHSGGAPGLLPAARYAGAAAVALLAVSIGCAWFRRGPSGSGAAGPQKSEPPRPQPAKGADTAQPAAQRPKDGLGPGAMTGQAELLTRLTKLLQEVDSLKGEEQRAERAAASKRVEAELNALEKQVGTDVATAAGKQQAGLIALVRAALMSDRDNESFSDWSEEGLLKAHGLTTYASQAYWDEAYADNRYGVSFDWYGTWEEPDLEGRSLATVLRPFLAAEARILMLGSGNSNMSVLMYQEGFKNIVNVDISEPVIAQMQERYGHLSGMTWRTMDAAALEFAGGSFDVAIEKGLFDALFAGTGTQVQPVLKEVQRVLRKGGKFLSISFSEDRMARLFMPSEEVGEESSIEGAALSCQVEGTLRYAKGRNRTAQHDGQTGQRFHIYGCVRSL